MWYHSLIALLYVCPLSPVIVLSLRDSTRQYHHISYTLTTHTRILLHLESSRHTTIFIRFQFEISLNVWRVTIGPSHFFHIACKHFCRQSRGYYLILFPPIRETVRDHKHRVLLTSSALWILFLIKSIKFRFFIALSI